MLSMFRDFRSNKEGVTLIEYALIAGLVSVVSISLLSSVGAKVKNTFSSVNTSLTSA
jgi:pilus assembly protein Flp/PilA